MNKNIYFILVAVSIMTYGLRSVYEILKYKKILRPDKLSFVVMFINMGLLWTSWFELCRHDLYRMNLAGIYTIYRFFVVWTRRHYIFYVVMYH